MRRARQTRPRTLVRTVTAALALVLVAPLAGSTTATADEPAPQARKLASQRQVALATPGDFTGYGFDQCVAPTQSAMDTWWKKSPFTAVGIYISGDSRACRTAAQPQPHLGRHPGRPRLAAAAHRPRPAGVVPAALPALQGRLQDLRRAPPAATPRRPRRVRPRPTRTPPTRRRTASAPGSTIWYDLEGFNLSDTHCRESALVFTSALGDPDQGARLHRRLLLQRQLGHQDARRRPHPAPRPVRPAGPHLDRPLGRRGQHLDDLHPRGRLASRRPDEAVPRRPQRDVGRRHDQHRQQLHRPRRRLRSRVRRAAAPAPGSASGSTPRSPPSSAKSDARQGAAVPAHRAGHLLRSGQRLVRRRHDRRRPAPGRPPASSRRPTPSRSGTGPRCSPPVPVRRSSAGRSTSRSTGSSGRSTRPAPGASGRPACSTPRPRRPCGPTSHACGSRVSGVATPPDLEQAAAGPLTRVEVPGSRDVGRQA